jgi:hypothetical protein
VEHTLKIVSLGIGLTAFAILAILGFAVWVFLPLLPAAIILVIALSTRGRATRPANEAEENVGPRKAA